MNTTTERIMQEIRTQAAKQEYPTLREIATACGVASTSVVLYHLRQLAAAGKITFSRKTRSIRIVEK